MRITAFCAILIITNENLPYQPAERCTYHKAKVSYHDLKYPVCCALIDPVNYVVRAAYPTFFVTFRGSAWPRFQHKDIRECICAGRFGLMQWFYPAIIYMPSSLCRKAISAIRHVGDGSKRSSPRRIRLPGPG